MLGDCLLNGLRCWDVIPMCSVYVCLMWMLTWLVCTGVGWEPPEAHVFWQGNEWLGWTAGSRLQHASDEVPRVAEWNGSGEGISTDEGRHTELASWFLVKAQPKFFKGISRYLQAVTVRFLGRLLPVDLITLVGLKCPCPSVHPSTKSFFDFNEIWYVGRGRRVMHDGMQYDPIRGQGQGHEPMKVGNSTIFKGYLLSHL